MKRRNKNRCLGANIVNLTAFSAFKVIKICYTFRQNLYSKLCVGEGGGVNFFETGNYFRIKISTSDLKLIYLMLNITTFSVS